MFKTRIRFLCIYVTMIFICGIFFASSTFAFDGNAGNDGGVSGSVVRCGKRNGKYFPESGINSCYGGAWVYYKTPDAPARYDSNGNETQAWKDWHEKWNDIEIPGSNSGSISGGHVKGCASVGGYYRLAPFQYKDGGTVVEQVGLYQAYIFKKAGGWYTYNRHGFPGSKPWKTAMKDFQEAKKDPGFADKTDDVTGKSVSWFCYKEDPHRDHEGEMHSWSEIKLSTDGYDIYEISEDDGYVGVTLSTNDESVDVYFGHTLYYEVTDEEGFADNESAKFKAEYQISGGGADTSKDEWSADGTTDWEKELDMNSNGEPNKKITVHLNPGETKTVCRKISGYYSNMTFEWNGSKYTVDREDKEDSEACATITRAKDPGPPDGNNLEPVLSGGSKTGRMFAGEKSTLSWNAVATGSNTRRLAAFDTISYLVNPYYQKTDNGYVSGSKNYQGNGLCAFVGSQLGANTVGCATVRPIDERSSVSNPWDTATKPTSSTYYSTTKDGSGSQLVVVPEIYQSGVTSIGAKYCTTLGYRLEYWSAVNTVALQKIDENVWTHDSNRDYWYIFDSACSVIAKRPQVAVWNGSAFSAGGINTALSPRYTKTDMGTLVSEGGNTTAYGSWAEYMAIGGGSGDNLEKSNIFNFSSAAGLTLGAKNPEHQNVQWGTNGSLSNLTIANTSWLGSSGIETNGAYQQRMEQYLRSKAEERSGSIGPGTTSVTGTQILSYTGDLDIWGNIESSLSSIVHSDRKNLPQMVIFVDGNIKVHKDVERIDAWLIAKGNLNTCAEYATGTTQAGGDCSKRLQFNGPVSAGSVSLHRTFGAENGNSRYEPAEIFNMRPDAYIWAYNQSLQPDDNGGYDYKAVYSRELAPRY